MTDNRTVDPAWRVSRFMRPGKVGEAELHNFTVTKEGERFNAVLAAHSQRGRMAPQGRYIALRINETLMMSDTPNEYDDHLDAIEHARGRVLIHGLGLGCLLNVLLWKDDIEHIDVVEKSADVIALVSPYYLHTRVSIHHGDAATKRWPKDTRWDYAWHDIWSQISDNNLEDATAENGISYERLFKRFRDRADRQDAWGYKLALGLREEDNEQVEAAAVWRMRFIESDVDTRVEMLVDATTPHVMERDQWLAAIKVLPAMRGEGSQFDALRRMAERGEEMTDEDAYWMLVA